MHKAQQQLEDHIFRAYDIRGIVGQDLTDDTVYRLGRAFAAGAMSQGQETIIVAADGRLSSPRLKELLSRGLKDSGAHLVDIGFVPTPVLYFAAHQSPGKTGIMITGSHNPKDYNGFKMMIGGVTLDGDDILALKGRMLANDYSSGAGRVETRNIDEEYCRRILDGVRLARPLKVVVDCGNGIPGQLAPALLRRLGCDVIPLYCDVDGHFPNHHPDPGKPENLRTAIATVKAQNADLGLAFDGDGDRVGVITPQGRLIYPDRVMMLFAEDLLQRHHGAEIIFDVKCSRRLAEVIRHAGGVPRMWKTGHSLIKRRMKESGALLGGEMSGHIFFAERWYGFDDGLYSAARLLEILSRREEDADAVFAAYPEDISTPELTLDTTDSGKFAIIEQLQQQDFPGGEVTRIDGLRVDYPDGWGLARASNTTPVLVLRFEARNRPALERISRDFAARLQQIAPDLDLSSLLTATSK